MSLPTLHKISFEQYKKDLVQQALDRMLSQHYDKCVLRQFVAAFVDEAQEAYDACIALQEGRTVYSAEGENLDALGRIVGEDRAPWTYDDSTWMFFDRQGQGFDQVAMWCLYGPIGQFIEVDDAQYRTNILAKAVKNHTLTGSVPEILNTVKFLLDTDVSFEKTGPNEVRITVNDNISTTQLALLTRNYTDKRVDEGYFLPYPATLNFSGVMMYAPGMFFMFDRADRCFDVAPMGVGVTHDWRIM